MGEYLQDTAPIGNELHKEVEKIYNETIGAIDDAIKDRDFVAIWEIVSALGHLAGVVRTQKSSKIVDFLGLRTNNKSNMLSAMRQGQGGK